MLIGANWISPNTLPTIRELLNQGSIDFCEIMVDNFAHLPANEIRKTFPDIPIALHIVASRFLEKTDRELQELAKYLRDWIRDLQPLYVSDHLLQHTINGCYLPFVAELDYVNDYHRIKNRILLWQEMLGVPILFENHASWREVFPRFSP